MASPSRKVTRGDKVRRRKESIMNDYCGPCYARPADGSNRGGENPDQEERKGAKRQGRKGRSRRSRFFFAPLHPGAFAFWVWFYWAGRTIVSSFPRGVAAVVHWPWKYSTTL